MSSPSPQEVAADLSLQNLASGHRSTLDTLLADVPLLSVGLLGLAVLTFFMILKKVKLASFFLLSSVLFTFFAAIVDLARISLKQDNSRAVQKEDNGMTDALVLVREALSSIASGLRFLYFWAFVSQAPLCEQGSASFLRLHSGSWLHWGLTGTVLRWSTLVASVSIFVLQALWRLVHPLRKFGPVYDVESAFEITASGVYIIKLILNVMIVEEPCRRQTLWQYSTAFFTLLINLGVGLGNLLNFTFSETALGRLLLAIELYILIVSSMVFTFYPREPIRTPSPSRDKRASSFYGLHVSKSDADLGLVGEDVTNPTGSPRPTVLRALSWLSWNGNESQRYPSQFRPSYEDGRRPTSDEATERGVPSSPSEKRLPFAVPNDIQPSRVNSSSAQLPPNAVSSDGNPFIPATTTSPDPPTLGSDGITEAREPNHPFRRLKQPSDRSIASSQQSGYENLLREQDQLERSIAALKSMFSQRRSGEGEYHDAALPSSGSKLRESSTTAYGPTSASNRSDFSLSVFPEPPEVPGVRETLSRSRTRSSSVLAPHLSFDIVGRSFPVSTGAFDDVTGLTLGGLESAGTHYDVTSFIGDLTSPEQQSASQIAKYLKDSDTDSEPGSADLATIETVERRPSTNAVISRPQLVEKTFLVPEIPDRSFPARSHDPSPRRTATDTPARQSPTSDFRTFTPPSRPSARPSTPAGRVMGLPSRPKLDANPPGDQ